MKKLSPTQAARLYGLRAFGSWYWTLDPDNIQRKVIAAYVAGVRHGKNGRKRNGK